MKRMTRQKREKTIRKLGQLVEQIYGPRCLVHEGGCMACTAWAAFDMMERLTDSSLLEDG